MNAANDIETEFLIYKPGYTEALRKKVFLPRRPKYTLLNDIICEWIGDGCGFIEHVSVLFKNEQADMFVHETGAIRVGERSPLQVNPMATKIYHAYSVSRGMDMKGAPWIYGVAVISKRRIWF